MEYVFRRAEMSDLTDVMEIISQAVARMLREGKRQWSEAYPTSIHIMDDIENGNAYVLDLDGRAVAYGAVIFSGDRSYDDLRGKWLSARPYVVVHRLAVAQAMQGNGLGVEYLKSVEALARSKGIGSFKIDTNFDNYPMLHILEKDGFTYCGEIRFGGDSRRAYEKLI